MRKLLSALLSFSCCYVWSQPLIHQIAPAASPPGTQVTITGQGFHANNDSNIVFFGAVRAQLINSSANSLVAKVPFGATYDFVTVTSQRRTAYSKTKFLPNGGAGEMIGSRGFSVRQDFNVGNYTYSLATSDLDGNGLVDLIIISPDIKNVRILKNTSTIGTFNLQPFNLPLSYLGAQIAIGDLNSDGKPDILVSLEFTPHLSIFLNNSTPGNFSFEPEKIINSTYEQKGIVLNDIDGDGKVDIVAANILDKKVSVFRNTSEGGLSFNSPVSFEAGDFPGLVQVADFNNDGKHDIVIGSAPLYHFSILKNLSSPGNIQFNPREVFSTAGRCYNVAIGDLNNDGKTDIVTGSRNTAFSVFTNTFTGGGLSFSRKDMPWGDFPQAVGMDDLDADGKPDIVVAGEEYFFSVYQNSQIGDSLSFRDSLNFGVVTSPGMLTIADIDNSGKPEIILGGNGRISVYKNQLQGLAGFYLCSGKSGQLTGDISGTNYQWQVKIDSSGYKNISDAGLYSSFNSQTLTIKQAYSSWYGYQYRLLADGKQGSEYVLKFRNQWNGSAGNNWNDPANWSCASVPDANTDVIIESGTVQIDSATIIRSLKMGPGVQIIVSPGATLTILH